VAWVLAENRDLSIDRILGMREKPSAEGLRRTTRSKSTGDTKRSSRASAVLPCVIKDEARKFALETPRQRVFEGDERDTEGM